MNRLFKSDDWECDYVEDTGGSLLRNVFVYQSHLWKILTFSFGLSPCSKEVTRRHTTEYLTVKINCSVYPAL